jgi:glycosyltransferase involved in cell wall biosynthesis
MKLVANLIVQDGMPDVIRSIETVAPIVDEFLVMDGGSTDGTWELLKRYEKSYKLTLFKHPYDDMAKQRNRLIKKSPVGAWIITIDHDEEISWLMRQEIRRFITAIDENVDKEAISIVSIPFYELAIDMNHILAMPRRINAKLFYNNGKIGFIGNYHCILQIKPQGKEVTQMVYDSPETWTITHHAFMDPRRLATINEEIDSGKRPYEKDHWDMNKRKIAERPFWRI